MQSIMVYESTYRCGNEACDGPIPPDHVMITAGPYAWMRTVRVICPHCRQAWACDQVAVGGFWHKVEPTERITAPSELAQLQRKIDKASGVIQVA